MAIAWDDQLEFELEGTRFRAAGLGKPFPSTVDLFCVLKNQTMVEAYADLVASVQPKRIVELGIYLGGSTAMLAALAQPDRLLAVDISTERIVALDEFIEAKGYSGRVHAHYGVDQADRGKLGALANEVFGDDPIDFVLDDASHHLPQTRASFETLFPRLRPGGLYVIEDWAWGHGGHLDPWPDKDPLSSLLYELALSLPALPGLIDAVNVTRHWVSVTRGPLEVDPRSFRLSRSVGGRTPAMLDRLRDHAADVD